MPLAGRLGNSSVSCGFDQLANAANVIGEAKPHRGRDAVRFMDAAEIMVSDIERDSGQVISSFLPKPLLNRVKRRCAMRSVKFCRSTSLVEIVTGKPATGLLRTATTEPGE